MKNIYLILVILFAYSTCNSQLPSAPVLHLKADAGIQKNGSKVLEWQDISTPNVKAFQTDADLQPTFIQNGNNGLPTVRFDGSQSLQASSVFPTEKDYTFFCVANYTANATNTIISGARYGFLFFYNPPRLYQGAEQVISSKQSTLDKLEILSLVYTEADKTAKIFVDGVLTGEGVVGPNFDPTLQIGIYADAYNFNGELPELILYDRSLNPDEQSQVESYLFDKYLIERPSTGGDDNTFTEIPSNYQVYQRDSSNKATVRFAGNFSKTEYNKLSLMVLKNEVHQKTIKQNLSFSNGIAPFDFSYKINAELSNYKFILIANGSQKDSVLKTRDHIVAGEVILLEGQSNTQVNNNPYTNPFIRTFGSQSGGTVADTAWSVAGDYSQVNTSIGAWGVMLARNIIENQKVPVCVINGSLGGTTIESHIPNPANRYDYSTIYGRFLYRITKAKLCKSASVLFWYQGESDHVINYRNSFITLTDEWLKDFPNIKKIYTVQIHHGCGYIDQNYVRETQRTMPDYITNVEVETVAAAALPEHDGCHYNLGGYEKLGNQFYKLYLRDFFGSNDTVAISSPNINEAIFTTRAKDKIALIFKPELTQMRAQADTSIGSITASLKDYFTLDGNAKIKSISCKNDTVFLELDRKSNATKVSYLSDLFYKDTASYYQGPWLVNQRNYGALTFEDFPINEKKAIFIEHYTEELIACIGNSSNDDNMLVCGVSTTGGLEARFQWYKDGVILTGETDEILVFEDFNHSSSGLYTCKVFADNYTKSVETPTIPVYALAIPVIVEQPEPKMYVALGSDYKFNLKVHYAGKMPPLYKDDFQWCKASADGDTIKLQETDKITGVKSSVLSIRDIQAEEICKKGEFYFARVEGQCGTTYTDPFIISEEIDVVFRDNPQDVFTCPNEDVAFEVTAVVPEDLELEYQWQKNGVDIQDDAKFNGANAYRLQLFDVDVNDVAGYSCVATISKNQAIFSTSKSGELSLKETPEGVAKDPTNQDVTIKRGEDITFQVVMNQGDSDDRIEVSIKWTYKDQVIKQGIWDKYTEEELLILTLKEIDKANEGLYTCEISNECSKAEINFNLHVTKWEQTGINENESSKISIRPNPASDYIEIFGLSNTTMDNIGDVDSEIKIYNTYGECVMKVEILHASTSPRGAATSLQKIDVSHLPVGVYLIQIGKYSEKCVLVR